MEYDGNLSREQAQAAALEDMTRIEARNEGSKAKQRKTAS
jgi:hypothetical protein